MFTLVGLRKNIFVFHSSPETEPSPEKPTPKPNETITQNIPPNFPKVEFFRMFYEWKKILPSIKDAKATKFNELLNLCKNSGMNIHPYLNTPDKMNAFAELLRNTEITKRITGKNLANTYPKKLLTKEELQIQIDKIKAYDKPKLTNEIQKYKNARFNQKFADNSFEIIALYQTTLNILDTTSKQDVDGQFGDATLIAIRAFQTKNSIYPIDGFPGPKTTRALINALGKIAIKSPEAPQVIPNTPAVLATIPEQIPKSDLEKKLEREGYILLPNGDYTNKEGSLTITTINGKYTLKRSAARVKQSPTITDIESFFLWKFVGIQVKYNHFHK